MMFYTLTVAQIQSLDNSREPSNSFIAAWLEAENHV